MKIYLAHALTGAPENFRQRMLALRQRLNLIPEVQVLEFNWIPGVGPDKRVNTYRHDMSNVIAADLMVGVLDHPSIGLGIEIERRFSINKPIILFYPKGQSVTRIVVDAIALRPSTDSFRLEGYITDDWIFTAVSAQINRAKAVPKFTTVPECPDSDSE